MNKCVVGPQSERNIFCTAFTKYAPVKKRRRGLAVFDCETEDGTLLGRIGGICFTSDHDYPEYHRFGNNGTDHPATLAFLKHFLTKKYRGFVAYAHKGLSFDVSHIVSDIRVINWLIANRYEVQVDRSFAIVRRGKHSWYLGDSLRIIPESLDKVLEKFAPDFTKAPLPTTPFSWHDDGWKARIVNDTLGLYSAMRKLEDLLRAAFDIPLSLTISSTALRAGRSMLPLDRVERPSRKVLDWLRAGAFSGGRIEVYYQGVVRKPTYVLDINSAYAWAMTQLLPLGRGRYTRKEPRRGYYIARCRVNVPTTVNIPPVISRLFHQAFVTGRFQAMLTKEEVVFARSVGATVSVIEAWSWRRQSALFKDFIEKCAALRAQDYHGPLGKTVKLLQNSLYGIMGMSPFRKAQLLSPDEPPLPWIAAFDHDNGKYIPNVYEATLFRESPTQMPHWAAIITARVRIRLTQFLLQMERAGFSPMYSHTDSIWIAPTNGQNALPPEILSQIGEEYGKLKLEHVGNHAVIVSSGEAMLTCDDGGYHIASKGWKGTPDAFLSESAHEIEQVQIYRAGTALKKGKAGHRITKRVMDFTKISNRNGAPILPGPTTPRRADSFDYDYFAFKNWYVGKLLHERPLSSRWRTYRHEPDPRSLAARRRILREEEYAYMEYAYNRGELSPHEELQWERDRVKYPKPRRKRDRVERSWSRRRRRADQKRKEAASWTTYLRKSSNGVLAKK